MFKYNPSDIHSKVKRNQEIKNVFYAIAAACLLAFICLIIRYSDAL